MIITFTIYESATGFILRRVYAPPDIATGQVRNGEEFYLNCPDWATHIIDNEPVRIEPPPPPPPTEAEIIASLTQAVQRHLDATARGRNYDGILSLCSYATSTDPVFSAEGQAGVAWRDACWRRCYEVMADVRAGVQPVPTAEELIASLPVMTWEEQSPV
jgi:hypothetical protein